MPRGQTPRQPSRTSRQDRVARTPISAKAAERRKNAAHGAIRGSSPQGTEPAPKGRKKLAAVSRTAPPKKQAYTPPAPELITEILHRLNQLYPDVTCALTHASAWELLVATILSAQSTDVNVNRVTPELFRIYPTVQAFPALTPEQL